MKELIFDEIKKVLKRDFILENPKDKNLAHFATPLAFSLAKELKRSPLQIAEELANKFQNNACFEKVEAIKGYLNFKLSRNFLNSLANKALKEPQNFTKGEAKNQSFLLEFVSANPTGPLHIGHARGAIFGDTLARLARHLGFKFDTEYYINDAGNQIELLGLSVFYKVKILHFKERLEYPKDCYQGEYIEDLAREAFLCFEKEFFTAQNAPILARWAKDKMLELIVKNLAQARIEIQNYVSETSFYSDLAQTLQALKERGGTYEKDGKIWLASSLKGDEKDRVIVRENGSGTYLAADIVYHKNKLSRIYDKCINIWGADHHGYIIRMKAAMEFLGFNADKLEIILAQMVSLLKDGKPFKMGKRTGNFILMSELLDELGVDAFRFIFLSKKCDTHLEFDIDELKKQNSSNPVFYINYAYARINQIFIKAKKSVQEVINSDFSTLNEDALNLAFESLNLESVLKDAFQTRSLHKIADYLKNLAAAFHKFYNENRVVGANNENDLLKLFALIALSIETSFKLMGIEAKKKMEH